MNLIPVEIRGDLLQSTDGLLKGMRAPSGLHRALQDAGLSRSLQVGFRPTDIRVLAPDNPKAHLAAEVLLHEIHGQTSVATLKSGERLFKLKVSTDALPSLHASVGLEVNLEKLHCFRPEAGTRIEWRGADARPVTGGTST